MKRFGLVLAAAFCLLASVLAQSAPTPEMPYRKATLAQTLEIIRSAKREIYVFAPSLRNVEVARALHSRTESGVVLRLLIANKAGHTGFETNLRTSRNVEARWLPERIGGAMLMVDDAALVMGSVVSGLSGSGESIAVTRPELMPALGATLKQLFARAKRLK